jgi:hypothetical protein
MISGAGVLLQLREPNRAWISELLPVFNVVETKHIKPGSGIAIHAAHHLARLSNDSPMRLHAKIAPSLLTHL